MFDILITHSISCDFVAAENWPPYYLPWTSVYLSREERNVCKLFLATNALIRLSSLVVKKEKRCTRNMMYSSGLLNSKMNHMFYNIFMHTNVDTLNRIWEIIKVNKPYINKPYIFDLIETEADESWTLRFCDKFKHTWEWPIIPLIGLSGGTIVLWRLSGRLVTPLAISRRSLHLIISSQLLVAWILSIVYNRQFIEAQRSLWNELTCISILNLPWSVIGDLNAICFQSEHKGGSFKYYSRKIDLFNDFIIKTSPLDINYCCPDFTWKNGQSALARR